ncbi:hypothetical protein [Prochlorococcus sp. MIT 1341]|uniref:hypothetical protein n=1 Tax=Prochlorococcus sp. MIT 1341 TaxID=3096221 RepID=UPI002A7594AB|nr:hypothetical protein [Prochlorococcus sp. MIT 1341]
MNNSLFFRITAWICFLFAIYSWLGIFNRGTFLWVPFGVTLIISFSCILYGSRKVASFMNFPGISFPLSKIILMSCSVVLFIGSMNGLVDLLFKLPFYDKSFLLFPIFISTCIFGGVSINLAQID